LADEIDRLLPSTVTGVERVRVAKATEGRRLRLKRDIETYWAKWTKPITLRSAAGRSNLVSAIYEYTAANLLLKGGFLTRQTIDVVTNMFLHLPTRALANAIVQHGGFWRNANSTAFWQDANKILGIAAKTQIEAIAPAVAEFKEAM